VREVSLTGWYTGYVMTAAVVALVVVLVAAMLFFARRIGLQARQITSALDDIRIRTLPLGQVATVADGISQATDSLSRIRKERGGR
jgi:hypothetical protein